MTRTIGTGKRQKKTMVLLINSSTQLHELANLSDNKMSKHINMFLSNLDPLVLALTAVGSMLVGILVTLSAAVYFCKR